MIAREMIAYGLLAILALFAGFLMYRAWRDSDKRQTRLRNEAYFREERAWAKANAATADQDRNAP